jgi:hypothetical protein
VLEEAAETGDHNNTAMVLWYRGAVHAESDQQPEALATADRLEAAAGTTGVNLFDTHVAVVRSLVALSAGDQRLALRFGRDALAAAAIPASRMCALPVLAENEVAAGMTTEASNHIVEFLSHWVERPNSAI